MARELHRRGCPFDKPELRMSEGYALRAGDIIGEGCRSPALPLASGVRFSLAYHQPPRTSVPALAASTCVAISRHPPPHIPRNTLAPPPPQAGDASVAVSADLLSSLLLSESASSVAVLVNGVLRADLSRLSGLPKGVYVGGLKGAPAAVVAKMVRRGCGLWRVRQGAHVGEGVEGLPRAYGRSVKNTPTALCRCLWLA